jgi:hypothetical protein
MMPLSSGAVVMLPILKSSPFALCFVFAVLPTFFRKEMVSHFPSDAIVTLLLWQSLLFALCFHIALLPIFNKETVPPLLSDAKVAVLLSQSTSH